MNKENWYCIKFDIPQKNIKASDFAKKMQNFLEEIENFNHSIVGSIDETYSVVSYIEDFETGSIKWWIVDKLQKFDDKAIEKFVETPVKTTIASILKTAKKYMIQALLQPIDNKQKNIKIIEPILQEIESKREELQNNKLFISLNKEKLLDAVSKISEISNDLDGKIKFIEDYNKQNEEIEIAKDFRFERKLILEDKEVQEIVEITNDCGLILLTPTFKDNCKWEFDDGGDKILCDILDFEFFNEVKNRNKSIKANDVYVVTKQTTKKFENGKWEKQYAILKVIKIMEPKGLFD